MLRSPLQSNIKSVSKFVSSLFRRLGIPIDNETINNLPSVKRQGTGDGRHHRQCNAQTFFRSRPPADRRVGNRNDKNRYLGRLDMFVSTGRVGGGLDKNLARKRARRAIEACLKGWVEGGKKPSQMGECNNDGAWKKTSDVDENAREKDFESLMDTTYKKYLRDNILKGYCNDSYFSDSHEFEISAITAVTNRNESFKHDNKPWSSNISIDELGKLGEGVCSEGFVNTITIRKGELCGTSSAPTAPVQEPDSDIDGILDKDEFPGCENDEDADCKEIRETIVLILDGIKYDGAKTLNGDEDEVTEYVDVFKHATNPADRKEACFDVVDDNAHHAGKPPSSFYPIFCDPSLTPIDYPDTNVDGLFLKELNPTPEDTDGSTEIDLVAEGLNPAIIGHLDAPVLVLHTREAAANGCSSSAGTNDSLHVELLDSSGAVIQEQQLSFPGCQSITETTMIRFQDYQHAAPSKVRLTKSEDSQLTSSYTSVQVLPANMLTDNDRLNSFGSGWAAGQGRNNDFGAFNATTSRSKAEVVVDLATNYDTGYLNGSPPLQAQIWANLDENCAESRASLKLELLDASSNVLDHWDSKLFEVEACQKGWNSIATTLNNYPKGVSSVRFIVEADHGVTVDDAYLALVPAAEYRRLITNSDNHHGRGLAACGGYMQPSCEDMTKVYVGQGLIAGGFAAGLFCAGGGCIKCFYLWRQRSRMCNRICWSLWSRNAHLAKWADEPGTQLL